MLIVAKIEEFLAALFADRQTMRPAFELTPPGADKFAFAIEDHHGVQALAGGVHRVMDVDVALGILADAVSIAVLDGARQLAPVVNGLVFMLALSEDGRLGASLVGRAQERPEQPPPLPQ